MEGATILSGTCCASECFGASLHPKAASRIIAAGITTTPPDRDPTPVFFTLDLSSATQLNSKQRLVKIDLLFMSPDHLLIPELLIGIQDLHDPAVAVSQKMVIVMRKIVEYGGKLASLIVRKTELILEFFGIHRKAVRWRGRAVQARVNPVTHHHGAQHASAEKNQEERNDGNAFSGARQSNGRHA
jgi:hypothetical protein